MHRVILPLGFDAVDDYHTYGFDWHPGTVHACMPWTSVWLDKRVWVGVPEPTKLCVADHINWVVDEHVIHTSQGEAKKTIPYLHTQPILILRPRAAPFDGDARMDVMWTNVTAYDL